MRLLDFARAFCIAHHGACAHPDMGGCHEPETALFMRAAVDADVKAGKRQMPVLQVKPGLALLEELWFVTGPQAIADLARRPAQWFSVFAQNDNLLGTETIFGERAQTGHQVDVWIARFIVIDPVGYLAASQHLFGDEGANKGNVLGLAE